MALVSQAQDPIRSPSPSLTNPDMILPYTPEYQSSLPTSYGPATSKPAENANKLEQAAMDRIGSTGFAWSPKTLPQNAGKPPRPSMPGEWQSEEEVTAHNSQASIRQIPRPAPVTQHGIISAKRRSGMKFAPAIDPRLRQGLGLETPEYSPSVYSPTDSERAPKSPYQENDANPVRVEEPQPNPQDQVRAVLDEDENDPLSHAALSVRAEEILANAKRRLTAMENNLNRARSLSVSRSASAASNAESPPFNNSRSPGSQSSGNNWAISAAKLRQSNFASTGGNGGHSRVLSETSVPSHKQTFLGNKRLEREQVRSTSAMGSSVITGRNYDSSDTSPDGFSRRLPRTLEPLREDDLMSSIADESSHRGSPAFDKQVRSDRLGSNPELRRPGSNIRLSDLREQMRDLRGKITSLKERTREESLHRRSLQALKSPSPFTDAERWSPAPVKDHPPLQSTPSQEHSPDRSEEYFGDRKDIARLDEPNERHEPTEQASPERNFDDAGAMEAFFDTESRHGDDKEKSRISHTASPEPLLDNDTSSTSERPEFSGAKDEFDFSSEVDEVDELVKSSSPQSYHRTRARSDSDPDLESSLLDPAMLDPELPPPSLPEAHEDRPDAFDYETYVLNSTMGSFSRQGHHRSSSRTSTASTNSVSTTRPIQTSPDPYSSNSHSSQPSSSPSSSDPHPSSHSRQNSGDSISSVATFTTAASRTTPRSTSRTTNRQTTANGFLAPAQHTVPARPPSQASTAHNRLHQRPSNASLAAVAPPNPKRNSFSPARSASPYPPRGNPREAIVAALLAGADDGGKGADNRDPRATPDVRRERGTGGGALGERDEMLVTGVVGALQRVVHMLVAGDGDGDKEVRGGLEAARRILEGVGMDIGDL